MKENCNTCDPCEENFWNEVKEIVEEQTKAPWLGLFGTYKVNVLKLNVALDAAHNK